LALTDEDGVEERCRQAAAKHFDLAEIGGIRYREVYRRIESTRTTR